MPEKHYKKYWKRLSTIRDDMQLIFTLETMKFAQLSGRVKSLQATLASLLDIKPIIELHEGYHRDKRKSQISESLNRKNGCSDER